MLGIFVNAAFAVKGVAPDAKTLAGLKDMEKKHSVYIAQNFDNDGDLNLTTMEVSLWLSLATCAV